MSRTKQRALVTGMISNNAALLFAGILAIAGFLTLNHQTNHLTVWIGAIGYVDYILAYGYAKRHSIYGTIVGSISGATPLVAGYTAVTNHFDIAALLLFIMLVLWQMPHFYAIAIYRLKDYRTAGIPVWPVRRGVRSTKRQIVGFVAAFLVASCLLTVFGYTHYAYLIAMSLIGLGWLWFGIKGFHTANETVWARRMFLISLIAILGLDIMLSVGSVLI